MIEIISHFCIKRFNLCCAAGQRRMSGIVCSALGIILNIIMFALKLLSGIFSGSVAATADAVHNLTDSASSVVTLISFIISGQKKTPSYPMGKGRIEYVAGFIVSVVLISAGFELAKASAEKIISPQPVTFRMISAVMLLISFFIKLYMAFFNYRTGRRIDSEALRAAATDCICDSFSTLIALSALIASGFTAINIDAWGGLAVSVFILFAGFRTALSAIKMLIGIPADERIKNTAAEIIATTMPDSEVKDIVLHDYGAAYSVLSVKVTADGSEALNDFRSGCNAAKAEIEKCLGFDAEISLA